MARLVKRLEFLFELPARLKRCLDMNATAQAVRYFTKANSVLKKYEHMPSFKKVIIHTYIHFFVFFVCVCEF